jgi:hypothetical protein
MKNYQNIENCIQSGYGRGYGAIDKFRTAYDATGRSWIVYGKYGYWTARANQTMTGKTNILIGFDNLDQISSELSNIK